MPSGGSVPSFSRSVSAGSQRCTRPSFTLCLRQFSLAVTYKERGFLSLMVLEVRCREQAGPRRSEGIMEHQRTREQQEAHLLTQTGAGIVTHNPSVHRSLRGGRALGPTHFFEVLPPKYVSTHLWGWGFQLEFW